MTRIAVLLDLTFLRRTRSAYCLRRSGIDDSEKSRLNADGFEAEPAIKVLRPVFGDRHEEDEPESRGGSERGADIHGADESSAGSFPDGRRRDGPGSR